MHECQKYVDCSRCGERLQARFLERHLKRCRHTKVAAGEAGGKDTVEVCTARHPGRGLVCLYFCGDVTLLSGRGIHASEENQ